MNADMMIDPNLDRQQHSQQQPQQQQPQQFVPMPSEWGSIDMTQFGIPGFGEGEWEPDGWSDEGGQVAQVDLFDGFFFGGANGNT